MAQSFCKNVARINMKIVTYTFGFLALLFTSGCASSNFEWIKINPDKVHLAKNSAPYSENIRRVNLVFQLKEKDTEVYYSESEGFFASDGKSAESVEMLSALKQNIKKSQRGVKHSALNAAKPIRNPAVDIQSKVALSNPSNADKLNAALKIPLMNAGKNVGSFGPSASEVREMAFNTIKEKNPELAEKSAAKERRGKNLMWAGLGLIVFGGVMGLIFGKSAFLISVAGVVFAAIGYFFRI